jgi:hypothetical protein
MATRQAAAQDAPTVELASRVGGLPFDVAVQGNFAYVGVGPDLVILDVSDPGFPVSVGQSGSTPGIITSVAVAGNYAYIIKQYRASSLHILNVANATAPVEVGFYVVPGNAGKMVVAVAGDYAYIAAGDQGLHIVNVSDPSAPTEAGVYATPGSAYSVAAAGSYVYVAEAPRNTGVDWVGGGLRTIDVSNPAALSETGFVSGSFASSVAVSGSFAFVVDGSNTLHALSLADPATPTEVGAYTLPWGAVDVAVAGDYAYVAVTTSGLHIISVANPSTLTEVSFYAGAQYAFRVAAAGDYAYITEDHGWDAQNWVAASLHVLNVSNPLAPTLAGIYDAPTDTLSVAVQGNYAYVADGRRGLSLLNIANPENPVQVGRYDTPGDGWDVVVQGNYAYVADGPTGMRVINVANPMSPVEVGSFDQVFTRNLVVAGDYAYLTGGGGGSVHVICIANPADPVEVGSSSPMAGEAKLAVMGKYAYVADYSGLHILNIADPAEITEAGFYPFTGEVASIALEGGYAFVLYAYTRWYGSGWTGLRVINVSDPATPIEVAAYPLRNWPNDVVVAGDYAYIANWEYGLRILDVTVPATPTEVGFYDTLGLAGRLVLSGNYIHVAGGAGGGLVTLRLLRNKVTGVVSTAGGSLFSTNNDTHLIIPKEVFTQTVSLTYRHLWADQNTGALAGIGHTFDVTAVYSDTGQFVQPAPGYTYTVIVQYDDAEKGPAIENTLALYYWDEAQWVREPTSVLDIAANTVTATPDHFSLWAVLGETRRLFFPLTFYWN